MWIKEVRMWLRASVMLAASNMVAASPASTLDAGFNGDGVALAGFNQLGMPVRWLCYSNPMENCFCRVCRAIGSENKNGGGALQQQRHTGYIVQWNWRVISEYRMEFVLRCCANKPMENY